MRDWNEWKTRYKPWIRVLKESSKRLRRTPKVGLLVVDNKTKMFLPHYLSGGWQDGRPMLMSVGNHPALIRIPAVKLRERYLILDGIHRLMEFRPAFVLLDYVEFLGTDAHYWLDTYNVYWRKWAGLR